MRFFSQNFGTIKLILPGSSTPSHREGPGTEVAGYSKTRNSGTPEHQKTGTVKFRNTEAPEQQKFFNLVQILKSLAGGGRFIVRIIILFQDPVHMGLDPYGHHINLKSLKTSMT